MKEYDPYQELWKNLQKKERENGFDCFTKEEKIYVAINILDGEVYNRGINQFFSSSSGELYSEFIEGLKLLKAKKSLALLKQAAEILFGEIELNKIDKKYWKNLDNLGELLKNFTETKRLIHPFQQSE